MANDKFTEQPEESEWFDGLLTAPDAGQEIGPDEHAVSSAGLTDISDLELEKIMQEALSDEWLEDAVQQEAVQEPILDVIQDQEYSDSAVDPIDEMQAVAPVEPEEPSEEEEEEDEDPNAPVRKVRPKRKKGYGLFAIPHLLSMVIWLALVVVIGTSMGRLLWVCASDVLAFGRGDAEVNITITESDDLDSIANKLYNAELIRYPQLFKFYAELTNAMEDGSIGVGKFKLYMSYDYHALVNGLSPHVAKKEEIEVMIPEGYTCAQIFALLEEKGICTVKELEEYACTSKFESYEFLDGVERGTKYCLEGFLFPDTYKFYINDNPRNIYHKMLSRFEDQFNAKLQEHITTLNQRLSEMMRRQGYKQEYIDAHQMTLRDVVIVASMIEKESAHSGENYNISSVIYNRLASPEYPYLNIDATLVYALGGKSDLTAADKELDSPYNTYKYPGLTPTPISNPGLSSILAALSPADTKFYFYALNPSINEHHFSETYQQHQEFLESLR